MKGESYNPEGGADHEAVWADQATSPHCGLPVGKGCMRLTGVSCGTNHARTSRVWTDQAVSAKRGARVKRHPNERDPGGHKLPLEKRRRHFIQRLAVVRHNDLDAGRPGRARGKKRGKKGRGWGMHGRMGGSCVPTQQSRVLVGRPGRAVRLGTNTQQACPAPPACRCGMPRATVPRSDESCLDNMRPGADV